MREEIVLRNGNESFNKLSNERKERMEAEGKERKVIKRKKGPFPSFHKLLVVS